MSRSCFYWVLRIAFFSVFTSCLSASKENSSKYSRVRASTVLPSSFPRQTSQFVRKSSSSLRVPAEMIDFRVVVRPKTGLRTGPGTQYELKDKFLLLGDSVLVFERLDVWCKIQTPDMRRNGWVHCQSLKKEKFRGSFLSLDSQRLPAVFAIRDIGQVYDYAAKRRVSVKIPRGSMFTLLSVRNGRKLVLLRETASVMWVSEKDMQ